MNILVAASRQLTPDHEWIFHGIRNLFEDAYSSKFNWALYDKNPDLLNLKGPRTHRLTLQSNSFHHQSLLPFSAVVLAGTSQWQGQEMEVLYGPLSKTDIPLFAVSLSLKKNPERLSAIEQNCFHRPGNLVTAKTQRTADWFRSQDIQNTLLPCASLFAAGNPKTELVARSLSRSKIGFLIQAGTGSDDEIPESMVRRLCQSAARLARTHEIAIICPAMNDFMRFSTMFPEQVFYSYESRDYLNFIQTCDVVVTTTRELATIANSVFVPAVLLHEREEHLSEVASMPYVFEIPLLDFDELRGKIETVLNRRRLPAEIKEWKDSIRIKWTELLSSRALNSTPKEWDESRIRKAA